VGRCEKRGRSFEEVCFKRGESMLEVENQLGNLTSTFVPSFPPCPPRCARRSPTLSDRLNAVFCFVLESNYNFMCFFFFWFHLQITKQDGTRRGERERERRQEGGNAWEGKRMRVGGGLRYNKQARGGGGGCGRGKGGRTSDDGEVGEVSNNKRGKESV